MADITGMLQAAAGNAGEVDPFFQDTVMLLHGDGTNGAQNNTFLDSSTNNFTITRNGNTTQGTFSPFSKPDGRWGNYFDGDVDVIYATETSGQFTFGTGDYEYSAWVNTNSPLGGQQTIFGRDSVGNTSVPYIYIVGGSGTVALYYSSDIVVGSTVLAADTWYYITVSRVSGTTRLFINGVLDGSASDTANLTAAGKLVIGGQWTGNGNMFRGYISNARVVKGSGVTSVTVPTGPLTAISGTSLLTCQSNRFVDNSSNAFAITVDGNVKVTPFSPFPITTAYDPSVNGGAGYFDGSGDYLALANNAAFTVGTGAVTIEAWIYCTSLSISTYQGILSGRVDVPNAWDGLGLVIDNSKLYFTVMAYNIALVDSDNVPLNQWVHVVGVRNGSSQAALFVNGVRKAYSASFTENGTGSAMNVGRYYPATDNYYFSGYISNARILKGSAAYDPTSTTLTVPTAPLTAITDTELLCNFTNAGILDNTCFNALETVGNAQIDTTTKKYGTGSIEFDGTGDYLQMPVSPNLAFGTGDYTVEAWVYFTSISAGTLQIIYGSGDTGDSFFLSVDADQLSVGTFTAFVSNQATTFTTGVWYHIAACRSGTTLRLFQDGVQVGSNATDTTNWISNNFARIGASPSGTQTVFGFIDDLRITKGVARYTSAFTPPTKAFPDLGE